MTKMYTLKHVAQTTAPHPYPLNRNKRRIRSRKMAARQRNDNWSNTAATQNQYTVNISESKLPSTILLISILVFKRPKKTKKYILNILLASDVLGDRTGACIHEHCALRASLSERHPYQLSHISLEDPHNVFVPRPASRVLYRSHCS